jgi:hypothetical protein
MKNKFILFIVALLLVSIAVNARDIKVNLVDYQPKPVVPGSVFSTNFKVINTASEKKENITFTLKGSSDFSVQGDDEFFFSSLNAGEESTLLYTVKVKPSALSGFKTLNLRTEYNNEDFSDGFSISVKGIEATLSVDSVSLNPSEISPGGEATLYLDLTNNAAFSLRNVKAKLDFTTVPFAPLSNIGEKSVSIIDGKGKEKISFNIAALSNAVPNIYKIPLLLDYYDEFGQHYTSSNVVSVKVSILPKLSVITEKSELVEGKKGTVAVKIINSGLNAIKFATITSLDSEEFSLVSQKNFYLGDIDSDDFQTIDIELISSRSGAVNLPMQITFRDSNNKEYSQNFFITAKVHSVEEAKQLGIEKEGSSFWMFVIGAIVFALLILRFVRKKRNKSNN